MTAKESKSVACPGLVDRLIFAEQGERAEAEVFRTRSIGFMEHTSRADLYAEARLALHAAEAEHAKEVNALSKLANDNGQLANNYMRELGELRRRVLELCVKWDAAQKAAHPYGYHEGRIPTDELRQLLASDGGADGDNEGEGK